MTTPTQQLLDLSPELLGNVLSFLGPSDVARFGKTCRAAHAFIDPSNRHLWRSAFLQIFDNPEDAWSRLPPSYTPPKEDWDWYAELSRRLSALGALRGQWLPDEDDSEEATTHIKSILSIVDTADFGSQGPSSLNLDVFRMRTNFDAGLHNLIQESRTKKPDEDSLTRRRITRSMASALEDARRPEAACRLHVLYGLTNRERHSDGRARGLARRKVYDWSFTSSANDYGPFKLDGSGGVNWYLLESVCVVILRVIRLCLDGHDRVPQGFEFAIPHRTLTDPTIPEDWARVTGIWLGSYAFIDYADLFAFNTDDQIALRQLFDNDNAEAHGDLMRLDLKLDPSIKDDRKLRSNIPLCHDYPPLYFSGTSGTENWILRPMARVRGMVALLPGGREVRWKWIVNYDNQDMWQLEGVQPGGIRSGGVFGLWSSAGHEENGPVGPFCYFPRELCLRGS